MADNHRTVENGECVFCDIVAGRTPAVKVGESGDALAFLTHGPIRPGHTLVIPKRHAVELNDATPAEMTSVLGLAARIARLQRTNLESQGETLFQASGWEGEQSVFHLHLHVVPRQAGDGLDLTGWWAERMTKPPRAELDAIGDRLRGTP